MDEPLSASCPYCGVQTRTVSEEIAHMEKEHPEIVEERLRAAGLHAELAHFRVKMSGRSRE
jgi:hypothetical protein